MMLRKFCTCGLALLLLGCATTPVPRKIRLPPALSEASGLVVDGRELHWHNDSGDGPYLYTTNLNGELLRTDTLNATARDFEDLTSDPAGRLYVADTGNNRGNNEEETIYRYDPATRETAAIRFTYPGQDGRGRDVAGNYDCEAAFWYRDSLHLFTKDQLMGRGQFYVYHFRLPARPGNHVAELVDSLYLPRRVVTAAAIDTVANEVVLTAYNFRFLLGFLPSSGASLITLREYPDGLFLSGTVKRRNLSWLVPTQFEAVDFYDARYLYVASEGTKIRKHAVAKRKRRR